MDTNKIKTKKLGQLKAEGIDEELQALVRKYTEEPQKSQPCEHKPDIMALDGMEVDSVQVIQDLTLAPQGSF